jgi:ABC-type tungstate transport system substrate-binding protein
MQIRKLTQAVCHATPRDLRNSRRILYWLIAWMATWLGANLAVSYDILDQGLPATLAASVSLGLGIGCVFAYRRFLREADELRRKIELDALAVAFGVGVVGGLSYWLFGRAGAVGEVDLLMVFVAMMVTYSFSVFVGQVRYS